MTPTPPGSPLRPHLAFNEPEHPFGVYFSFQRFMRCHRSTFLPLPGFAPLSRAALLRCVCFPRLSSILRNVDPDSQRGDFELVAAALNGEAPLPRQRGAAARPAHGGDGAIVRIDVAFICPRGPVGNGGYAGLRPDLPGNLRFPGLSLLLPRLELAFLQKRNAGLWGGALLKSLI